MASTNENQPSTQLHVRKDAYYFQHDFNAGRDPKIMEMRSVYGAAGYGYWWDLLEMMAEEKDHRLYVIGKYFFDTIALRFGCDRNTAKKYVEDCVSEFHLFETDGTHLWNNSFLERMEERRIKSEKARESVNKRWVKRDTNVIRTQYEGNTIKERKGKEIKGKDLSNTSAATAAFDFPPSLDTPSHRAAWERWLEYRRQIKKPYKSVLSQRVALEQWSDRPDEFIPAINNSIGNAYQGIFSPGGGARGGGQQPRESQGERNLRTTMNTLKDILEESGQ